MSSDLAVLYQSARTQAYEVAIDSLLKSGDAYWCGCSRSDIPASGVYPGTCREGLFAGRKPRSVRLRTEGAVVRFIDRIQGHQEVDLEKSSGDFVIRRADGLPAYQLAVVVDDAFQEISEIVRGADLLDSTPRQILLQEKLGLTTPGYAHLPIAVDPKGDKLSKRLKSDPLAQLETHEALTMALEFLGQKVPPPGNLEDIWSCAIEHWNLEDVPQASERA